MAIYELCIRRPVFATVLSLLLVLLGIVSYGRLTVREYPAIDVPVVTVQTTYRGASAEIVESQVSQVLEASIAGLEGIEILSSRSRSEVSRIVVRFLLNTDPDVAASEVRDRVARVRSRLPDEIEEPVIAKIDADAQPIMYIAFTSSTLSPLEVTDIADRYVKDQIQNVPGVAEVTIFGERRYAMRIWVDRARLAAYSLTVQDVENALRQQNVEIPSGRIESTDREFTVLSRTGLTTPEGFGRIVVLEAGGQLVRLRDVAKIELGARDERTVTRFNGKQAISLGVVKQATANPLDVSREVQSKLPTIIEALPAGLSLDVAYDTSVFIDESIKSVYRTIVEAVILVVLVILIFLRSFRATLIPLVTIPVSLVATFAIMFAAGFSINTLTLLAMVLAIGLVVDDAIVVLENAHRYIEGGMRPFEAALKGTREIAFAVLAMTITLAAVYAPVAFTTGRTGQLFIEFAMTLAGAVLISGFVALTLTPMMCSRLLRDHEKHGRIYNFLERGLERLTSGYRSALTASLSMRGIIVVALLATMAGGYALFTQLKSELSPIEDRGVILLVGEAPEGSTIGYTASFARQFEPLMAKIPEVASYFAVAGNPEVTDATSFSRLKNWSERDRTQQQIVSSITPQLSQMTGMRAFANNPPSLGQNARSNPVMFVIGSSRSYEEMDKYAQSLLQKVREDNPRLLNIRADLRMNKPQLSVDIDRDKVADLGLSVDMVGRTLETFLGGRQVTRFNKAGEQYDVVVQASDADRRRPSDLSDIYVRGRQGEMIQISNFVRVVENVAPKELARFNQLRSVTLSATLAPGYSLGEALDYLERQAEQILPSDFRIDYVGESREFKTSSASVLLTFVLALGFIYLVLAAQFESFRDPLVIMITVPLSMAGAFLGLLLSGGTLNIYSQIGLVTLIGLITKHGILIVEFARQGMERGLSPRDAVIEAATLRLRPILMTTGAMVLGALPLALAEGAGAESRRQIGWVIVGGMSFGTLLTLFVVPTVFTLMTRVRQLAANRGAARPMPAE
jgi:multidrug efflux pump